MCGVFVFFWGCFFVFRTKRSRPTAEQVTPQNVFRWVSGPQTLQIMPAAQQAMRPNTTELDSLKQITVHDSHRAYLATELGAHINLLRQKSLKPSCSTRVTILSIVACLRTRKEESDQGIRLFHFFAGAHFLQLGCLPRRQQNLKV